MSPSPAARPRFCISKLTPGGHIFRVRAVDEAGSVDLSPAKWVWTVEPAPIATIDSGPDPELETVIAARFTFSANISGASFECALSSGETPSAPFVPCTSPKTYSGLQNGDYIFEVRAISPSGLVGPVAQPWEWTIADVTAPQTAIETGPPATTPSTSASFTFTSNEPEVEYECSLDGGLFEECEPAGLNDEIHHLAIDLTIGEHTLRVRAIDGAGHFDPTPASYTWEVVPAPETTILTGPDTDTASKSATFTFSGSPSGSTFECSLDGAAYEACASGKTYTGLAVGAHRFAVRTVDANGHRDLSPATHNWDIRPPSETTPPDTIIESHPPATTASRRRRSVSPPMSWA